MRQQWRATWYLFRSTFARRWGGLLAIVVLIGLVGGVGIGAVAGARRTQSSYPAYLARSNARTLGLLSAIASPGTSNAPYDAGVVAKIARLAHVKQVGDFTIVDPNIQPIGKFRFHPAPGQAPPTIGGSLDGEYATLDRATLTSGRFADPKRVDEVVMSAGAARDLGLRLGSVLPVASFTNGQLQLPNCCRADGTGRLAAHLKVDLKLVGIVVLHSEVIEDNVDKLADDWVLLTPTLMRELVPCCAYVTETSIVVDGGNRNVAAVESEIRRAIPKLGRGGGVGGVLTSVEVAKAERAVEPESIALGVFGAMAALAALLIAGQVIGRQLRLGGDERDALRALGASPATTTGHGLLGVVGSIGIGALLAGVIAVCISPFAPLGPVRVVYHPGIAFDWTVLGGAVAMLIIVLSAVAVAIAYRQAPHRIARRHRHAPTRAANVSRVAANAGLPTPAVTGIRFALDSGTRHDPVPARSAIVGAALALIVVTATVTFGSSLHALVSRPTLYGWNWNYEMLSGFAGQEDLPQKQITTLLNHDPYVTAWTGVYFEAAQIDGHIVPVLAATPNASVAPPVLSGHGLNKTDEVVLGAATLAALQKHVGDTVVMNAKHGKPTTLRIVGTATMPAIGNGQLHTTMGVGALLSYTVFPPDQLNPQGSTIPGPQAILVRTRRDANAAVALRSLQQINYTINQSPESPAGGVTGVLRPAEIVNYRSMGTTPALLGAALAVGAVAALTLTLLTSVRRRRRELALFKTLGFTRRQLAAIVAWQSTIAVTIGVVIGRSLWDLFAHAIHVVDRPTIPALAITLIAGGAVILANLVAAIPGLQAAHTRTALLLHAE